MNKYSPKKIKHAVISKLQPRQAWIVQRVIDKRNLRGIRLCMEGR